jgi:hypothetical protein
MAIWYIFWLFWYFGPRRKIWQPWYIVSRKTLDLIHVAAKYRSNLIL